MRGYPGGLGQSVYGVSVGKNTPWLQRADAVVVAEADSIIGDRDHGRAAARGSWGICGDVLAVAVA